MKVHINVFHERTKFYQCPNCDFTSYEPRTVKIHASKRHNIETFVPNNHLIQCQETVERLRKEQAAKDKDEVKPRHNPQSMLKRDISPEKTAKSPTTTLAQPISSTHQHQVCWPLTHLFLFLFFL